MVLETTKNITEYHDVFARSLLTIQEKFGAGDESTAKKLIIYNIRQAYVLYRMDDSAQRTQLDIELHKEKEKARKEGKPDDAIIQITYDSIIERELSKMKLDDMALDSLQIKMFTYMGLAGIKPVQSTKQRARVFEQFRGTETG